jgi:hypothetical protein
MAGKREDPGDQPKEPFVSAEDRPDVRINLDTPITELKVRDLAAIFGQGSQKDPFEDPLKAFFDKDFPEVAKDWTTDKPALWDKPPKSDKHEKLEHKERKEFIKEIKVEKLEAEGGFQTGRPIGPDPRIDQVIAAVSRLTHQVSELADQVKELRERNQS